MESNDTRYLSVTGVGWLLGAKMQKSVRDDEADGAQMGVLEEKGRFSSPFVLGSSGASVGGLL